MCLLLSAVLLALNMKAQKITISRDWKFQTGDSAEWSATKYNDAHWNNLKAGLWWAHAGYNYSGIAWYRKKIVIPSGLKKAVKKMGYLKINLGQIQDADQTFLNGKLIGETGSFSPFIGRWGEPRSYFIKSDQIKWDSENTIAVRVYGHDNNGGMHTGPYNYEPYKLSVKDFVVIREKLEEADEKADDGNKKFTIFFINKLKQIYKGKLLFILKNSTGKTILTHKKNISIGNGQSGSYIFNFATQKEKIYFISAIFSDADSKEYLQKNLIVSTIKNISLPVSNQPNVIVENTIKDSFVSTAFEQQKMEGLIGSRLDINLTKRLLQVDEDELLAGYLNRPGKQNWVGEHVGKYIETACNTWRYNHNKILKAQLDRIVYTLLQTQLSDGYMGTYTPDYYWTNWDVWSHKYNLTGLLAYYKTTGYTPALEAAKRIGNLLCKTFGNKPGQLDIITSGTHVGMAATSILDPITDLYRYTGNKKFLDFAHYIITAYDEPDGSQIITALLTKGAVNKVANGKAYEMLSNLTGIIKLYKITGEPDLLKAALVAWNDIVNNRLYVTGTASSYELFRGEKELPAGEAAHMGEGCVTTTWLQFSYQLFTLTGDIKYFNQLEKTVYNHLLGAENPQTGCVSYYTSLQNKKPYSCDITCCLSSIPRGISMIPLLNAGSLSGNPAILFYESGIVSDTLLINNQPPLPFSITSKSNFPQNGKVLYTVSIKQKAFFSLSFRVPDWVIYFTAVVDGKAFSGKPGEWLTIQREWLNADKIEVDFDMPVTVIADKKNYPGNIAFKRGPQILSVDSSMNPFMGTAFTALPLNWQLENNIDNLPAGWVGKQAYYLLLNKDTIPDKKLVLVPFADAGQTGAKAMVWLPKVNANK
jgi:DUF1680 family protein